MLAEAGAAADPGSAAVLARYADWRRTDRHALIAFTDGLVRLFASPFGPVRAARALGLVLFDLSPAAKSALSRLSLGFAGRLPRLARGLPLLPAGAAAPEAAPAAGVAVSPAAPAATAVAAGGNRPASTVSLNGYAPELCAHHERGGAIAEDFRSLRTSLLAMYPDELNHAPGRKIGIPTSEEKG